MPKMYKKAGGREFYVYSSSLPLDDQIGVSHDSSGAYFKLPSGLRQSVRDGDCIVVVDGVAVDIVDPKVAKNLINAQDNA